MHVVEPDPEPPDKGIGKVTGKNACDENDDEVLKVNRPEPRISMAI